MRYYDSVYGPAEFTEPVLIELMESAALRRLRGVLQHGVTALLGLTPPFSRFDHSVGAMLLVRRLGGSTAEQIAALLHDVSHTAFSHVIDFVFDDHDGQGYHEIKKEEFVARSDIPETLARHGLDWREFMDEDRFGLLERPLPALCADRLDYFFRDLEFQGLATGEDIRSALESLTVKDGRIATNDLGSARWLAYTFIEADRASWSNFREVGLYQLTAEAIKSALKFGLFTPEDLWVTDEVLWDALKALDHAEVRNRVALISAGTRFIENDEQSMFKVTTKVRSIDPAVVCGGSLERLSVLDSAFGRYRDAYLASKCGQWSMGVVPPPTDS